VSIIEPTTGISQQRCCPDTTQIGSTHRAKQWTPFTSPIRLGEKKTIGATRHGPCYPISPRNYNRAAQQPRWSPLVGKEKLGIKPLPNWRATRRSCRPALTCSVPGGGTDAVQSASLSGPSLSFGFPHCLVVPPPGRCQCYHDHVQHTTHQTSSPGVPHPSSKSPLQDRSGMLQQPLGRFDAPLHATPIGH
jgi:hypothetical protein